MSLSADYHDNKNFGTVWLMVSNSGHTVSPFACRICFEMNPNMLDLVLAAIAVWSVCDAHLVWNMVAVPAVYILVLAETEDLDS